MSWFSNLLRRARIRGLAEGKVQRGRTEALDDDAKDDAERWQDYGFAGHPGDGQGLVINADGHTVIIRMDRIAERPQLDAYEVAVWHKEGHFVKLKAGKVVELSCDDLIISAAVSVRITSPLVQVDASGSVSLNTPTVAASAAVTAGSRVDAPTMAAGSSLQVQGKEMHEHRHNGVDTGSGTSGPPV